MTDEEGFIRAIVDRPGDDTPRLAYADWLDDRADPRGPYLRAEADAVRRLKETADPRALTMWLATGPALAAGLDPVWVARVSRPPVGVCCDHVRFTERGARLSRSDVNELEHRLGVEYPAAYRAFLLNYNAGLLTPHQPAPEGQPSECNPLLCFYAVRHSYRTRFEEIADLGTMASYRLNNGLSPIAYSASGLVHVFVGVSRAAWGQVYSDDAIKPELALGGRPQTLAPGLPEYLGGLSPEWTRARQDQYDI